MTLSSRVARWLEPSVRLNWILVALIAVLSLVVLGKGQRIGDGSEYTIMWLSWAEQLQPYTDGDTKEIYQQYVAHYAHVTPYVPIDQLQTNANFINSAGEVDYAHFWFYSLCAAPFYWPLKVLGLDPGLSFNLLHITLIGLAVYLCHRLLNAAFATAFLLTVTLSPLLWFIDKAHTEVFTVCLVTGALAGHQARRHLLSALLLAVAGTQNPPFFILALLSLGWRAADRERAWRRADVIAALGVVGLFGLHTLYYYWRLGVITPQVLDAGAVMNRPVLLVKESLCFLIDPDVGLLANWPAASLLLVASAWLAIRGHIPLRWSSVAYAGLSAAILAWAHSRSSMFNHGGTISVSRYALWYLPFWCWMLWWVLVAWSGTARARLVLFFGIGGFGIVNGVTYDPQRPEDVLTPTRVSRWLYAHLPGLYDPVPEIFAMRRLRTDHAGAQWAIGDPACQKVLISRQTLPALGSERLPPVFNCPLLDSARVAAAARERLGRSLDRSFVYLNAPGLELAQPPAVLSGAGLSFGDGGQSARFTAAGWGHRDPNCLWSVGRRSEVVFGLAQPALARPRGLIARWRAERSPGEPGLRIRASLNGVSLQNRVVRHAEPAPSELHLPGHLLRSENHLVFETMPETLAGQLGSGEDSTPSGFCLESIQVDGEGADRMHRTGGPRSPTL